MSEQPPYFGAPEQPPPSPFGGPPEYAGWSMGAQPSGPPAWWGPPGRVRETGTTILLVVVTLGIYIFIYNYSVHDEMKRHSGRGIGGGIALLLSFLAGVAMPFITPAEVANLYRMRGWAEPVNGWTGLWAVLPSSVGYALFLALSIVSAATAPKGSGIDAAYVVAFLIYIVAVITGGIVWFVKTNAALNAYWRAVSAAPAGL